jgi:DNA-binding FrmR family transcriptional regulator
MKHSCHKQLIPNINRISGQINGVGKMIDEGKYCIDTKIAELVKILKRA